MSFFWIRAIFIFQAITAQPAYVYDGTSTVTLSGQQNWTLKYPLGVLCEDPNWSKTLIVDVNLTTCDVWGPGGSNCQGDLIMAFGTNTEYFALTVAYDGGMDLYVGEPGSRKSGGFIAPKGGLELFIADTTLEEQYYETPDKTWRETLIPDEDKTKWTNITAEGVENKWGPFTENVSPLTLKIYGSRTQWLTRLTVGKNGYNRTFTLESTWDIDAHAYFYMAMDYLNAEIFELRSIKSVDECTSGGIPTAPTTATPTSPSSVPTSSPSVNPSINPTDNPSMNPTNPTANPTYNPSENPTNPSASPSNNPSSNPTFIPSVNPSQTPTGGPTKIPSGFPTETPITTDFPTKTPSYYPSREPTHDGVVEESTTEEGNERTTPDDIGSYDQGDNSMFLWSGIAVGLSLSSLLLF